MHRVSRVVFGVSLVLLGGLSAVACGNGDDTVAPIPPLDAGSDAKAADAKAPTDATVEDAGNKDAEPDAESDATADGEVPDASPDASEPDATSPDAGDGG